VSPRQPLLRQVLAMSVRIVDRPSSGNVIALHPNANVDDLAPETARLYGLTVLAFLLHTPTRFGRRCVRCATAWPCEHLRLAYRLREGF
jgi:hypothetical protein